VEVRKYQLINLLHQLTHPECAALFFPSLRLWRKEGKKSFFALYIAQRKRGQVERLSENRVSPPPMQNTPSENHQSLKQITIK
jgi:hypothetical protein